MHLTSLRQLHFASSIPDQSACQPRSEQIDHVFKIADSSNELLQAFGLLYREYLHAGYIRESASELLFTKYHLLPETTIFVAKDNSAVVSTATIVRDNPQFGLPMDELYDNELNFLRNQGRRVLEVCSLASNKQKLSRSGIQNFIKLIFLYSIFLDADDICIIVNPRHVKLYTAMFGFKTFGEEKYYPRVNAPAVPLHVDILQARNNISQTCFTFSYSEHLHSRYQALKIAVSDKILGAFQDRRHGSPNPLDTCLLGHMLSVKNEILQSLNQECRKLLSSCYPGLCIEAS